MPKVSIIVPCYKVEKFLDRCVLSLTNQTLKDIEIILIDDGSPDSVPEMCDIWAQKDCRIKVLHKINEGLGMACNSGIEIATGEYIAFCDSDDYVDIECYQSLYEYAERTHSDAVYSGIKRVDQFGVVTPMSKPRRNSVYEEDAISNFQLDMIAAPIECKEERFRQMSAKIVLYSSKIISDYKVRFKSEREYVSEDLLFNLDFLQNSKRISELDEVYYYYYVNTQSLSQSLRKDRLEKYIFLRDFLLTNYLIGNDTIDFRNRINKMFIGYIRSAIQQIVNSSETYREKMKLLSDICNNSIWQTIDEEFPVSKLPLNKHLVLSLTKHKCPHLIYLLFLITTVR